MGSPETFSVSSSPRCQEDFFTIARLHSGSCSSLRAVVISVHAAPVLAHHADLLSGFPRELDRDPTVERPVKRSLRAVPDALHPFASSFWIKSFRLFGGLGLSCVTENRGVYGRR